ncbi:hypothetical protein [Azospirillum griseum]|uniref:Uncharacterized protein n=1 Tax=Azospirillum griseum TaxID=2496639 RepID=A0A431VBC0_9PROT|nr:hypothetical protein [Azospirillum griseum]RTR15737.1 hypothetical protein EJ903_22345 [Azospirillum griseum]
MFARIISAATLSAALLTAVAASASAAGFDSLLTDTKTAAATASAQVDRTDRDLVNNYIAMAQSIAAQGDEAKALSFLTFARAKLGLSAPTGVEVVGRTDSGPASFEVSAVIGDGTTR